MTSGETHILRKSLFRDLSICVVLAVIFAVLGIYDTDNLALPYRLIFWTVVMCLGGAVISVTEPLVFRKLLPNAHPGFQLSLITIIVTLPITVFLMGLNTGFRFHAPAYLWRMQLFSVLVISVLMVGGRYLIAQLINRGVNGTENSEPVQDPVMGFLKRLPLKFQIAELYGLSSEGHYLRVHMDKGSTLILMRMSDAVKELTAADGLQVHRSWWVARSGIADTSRKKGQRFLLLKDGATAPVSRSFLPMLKAAGLDR